MENELPFFKILNQAQLVAGTTVGIAGWKLFTNQNEDNRGIFDVPHFIVDAVVHIVGNRGKVINASGLFIDPIDGIRIIANANEIAHYEFGAALASSCVLNLLNDIEIGKTEMELADHLAAYGQPTTVQTICATGERFTNAIIAPRDKAVEAGDKFSVTMGLQGGLTSRSGYIVKSAKDLPGDVLDYFDMVVKPYFSVAATWYSSIAIGTPIDKIYSDINSIAPKNKYGWKLNPGHYIATEEWVSSPFYPSSPVKIQSGMMLQMDIIFHIPPYGGANAEDGIAIADAALREEIQQYYPETWNRIRNRRLYMKQSLGIPIGDEVLPLSNIGGYLRPLLLEKSKSMAIDISV
jgi:hypothetical protein